MDEKNFCDFGENARCSQRPEKDCECYEPLLTPYIVINFDKNGKMKIDLTRWFIVRD